MTATGEQKHLTLTETHDVLLCFDKGGPDPLRTLYLLLTFTDIAKTNVLGTRCEYCFLRLFVQMGC